MCSQYSRIVHVCISSLVHQIQARLNAFITIWWQAAERVTSTIIVIIKYHHNLSAMMRILRICLSAVNQLTTDGMRIKLTISITASKKPPVDKEIQM